MKKSIFFVFSCGILLLCTSSVYIDRWHGEYTPIFMKYADLEHSVSYQAGERRLSDPGKIYYKAPYIYINERYKGVHVIDNSDPSHPIHSGFVVAPGCLDIAIKGSILYLDNAVDLVAFDLNTRKEVKRIRGVFPEPLPPDGVYYFDLRPEDLVVTGWEKTLTNQ